MSIIIDMDRHFTTRLHSLICDIVDTCQIAEEDKNQIIAMIAAGLWFELTIAAHLSGLSEDSFVLTCRTAYRAMAKKIEREAESNHE